MKALSVDVGGTHFACAVVEDDRILARRQVAVADFREFGQYLPQLASAFHELLAEARVDPRDCAGMAASFPGIVVPFPARILSTPSGKYTDSNRLDLSGWCRETFHMSFAIENDARMALLGERTAGAARGFDDIVMVTLGTGVGGAAMIQGRLLRGRHYQAGCLGGHLPADFQGRACTCGSIGCVEAEASGWSLPAICISWPGYERSVLASEPELNFAALFRASRAGDPVATCVQDRCLKVWGAGLVGLVHAYDPEIVILGGAVMGSADQILPFIRTRVENQSWTPWGTVQVHSAELGNDAALLGATALLKDVLGQ